MHMKKILQQEQNDITKCLKINPKKFWKYIKNETKTNGITGLIKTASKDGQEIIIDNDADKCSAFINFFSSVFTKETFFYKSNSVFEPCNTKMNSFLVDKETVEKKLKVKNFQILRN